MVECKLFRLQCNDPRTTSIIGLDIIYPESRVSNFADRTSPNPNSLTDLIAAFHANVWIGCCAYKTRANTAQVWQRLWALVLHAYLQQYSSIYGGTHGDTLMCTMIYNHMVWPQKWFILPSTERTNKPNFTKTIRPRMWKVGRSVRLVLASAP